MNELTILTRAMIQERKDIVLAILGGFIAGLAGVILFSASGYLIAQTVFAPPLYTLIVLISVVKLLGLLRAVSRYGERLYSHRATFSLLSRLRVSFFAKLAPLTPGIHRKQRSGDLLARIVGDVESLQHYFLRVFYPPIILVAVFLATVLFASTYSLAIAFLLVVGMLLTAVVVPALVLFGQRRSRGAVRQQRAALSTELTEALYGYRELKLYGQLVPRELQLMEASAALAEGQKRAGILLLRGQSLHLFVTFLVSWGVLALGAYLIAEGALAGVLLAMLVLLAMTVFEEAAPMATLPLYKQDSEHAAKRLAENVRLSDDGAVDRNEAVSPGAKPLSLDEAISIELRQVCFQYGSDWRPTLRNVQFRLPAGSKTAIVGPSGAGKTTILELLLQFHVPTYGQILYQDIPGGELTEDSIWQAANVMLQHNHFFRGTIRDNLLLGGTHREDSALLEVLGKVELQEMTLEDEVLEKGENLSDGEKQRLAMARAMLKGGRLWLLDEPTASLDAVTEQRVLRQLFEQAKDDTVLMIRHRLTGLDQMDQILVMDQGTIVESGTYDELMVKQGYLYEMKQIERQIVGEEM
ncbi:amino acid ABC transporter ATP-binding/permease protein [Paenibacillus sp. JCM 10914]|uniref:thiol reductant ABC exporter subunit CydC n=1 Tax=Paenibacillus sp. JCM 10914 TaxID=1236974 RepID=UPI0003CC5AA5|nr:thiol reductant ABC exporter subunit CydC [Paenibacillus sp. JCM 10914]GAE06800.1 transport ATP-binding protein CydC [Paenibacillus sp. JCM 10914]